jgi:sporulation protein YlmC with PRC-barrel domain
MKNALATTSVVALLLAGPALAQAPATNSAAPAGNGPEIIVKQPPPVVTVQPHAPNVTVTPGKPDVSVQQAQPKVEVTNPKPNVSVDTCKPDVKVLPAEKSDVAVKAPADNAAVGSGTTTAPAPGAAAVAPTGGVFPMTDDAKSLMGKDVYGANGKKVGEINNLLVGPDNRVHAAVIEFGGFLGMGEHKVAVPWDQLNVTKDRVTANMTEDQIKSAPPWDKDRPGQFAEYHPYK